VKRCGSADLFGKGSCLKRLSKQSCVSGRERLQQARNAITVTFLKQPFDPPSPCLWARVAMLAWGSPANASSLRDHLLFVEPDVERRLIYAITTHRQAVLRLVAIGKRTFALAFALHVFVRNADAEPSHMCAH
jgi:hypothetical protein